MNLKGRNFLTLMDFTGEEIKYLLELGLRLKEKKKAGKKGTLLEGKNILLLFEKTSTRTRCSFEVAIHDEGGNATFLESGSSQIGKKESLEDSAKVLGNFFDGIEYRGFGQSVVEALAKYSGVPVWNGLTDEDHPTQILADLITIKEEIEKPLEELKIVYVGDIRNNMAYAWMYGAFKLGFKFVAYGPKSMEVESHVLDKIKGSDNIIITDNIEELEGADVIYTDIWASMGEEEKTPERVKLLKPYQVNKELLERTGNPKVKFMHCLPAFHDFETETAKYWKEKGIDIREVTDEVFRSENSIVFKEAENRMHSIKAVLVALLCTEDEIKKDF